MNNVTQILVQKRNVKYVTEELHTYHDQIIGVTNRNTMVLRLRNVKFFMSPTVCTTTITSGLPYEEFFLSYVLFLQQYPSG